MSTISHHRILIIDDNPAIHEDFRKLFAPQPAGMDAFERLEADLLGGTVSGRTAHEFEFDSALQGQEAFEKVEAAVAAGRPYTLAFVDVRMPPGWDGVETIIQLWRVDPDLQVVLCTAYSDFSWQDMRQQLGSSDNWLVLKKPFDGIEVQQMAHALTRKWELSRQAGARISSLEDTVDWRTEELLATSRNLKASQERFASAFHASPIASIIMTLPEQRLLDVNDRTAELLGISREQLIGQTAFELDFWTAPEIVERWLGELKAGACGSGGTTRIRTPESRLRDVVVSIAGFFEGRQSTALLLLQDVTEKLLLERQLQHAQKMDAIGKLATGIAHDFNNLLTVILGNSELLRRQLDDDHPGTRPMEQIFKAADRAGSLTRQLLMFSRKQAMQYRHLDINEVIGNVYELLRRLVGEHIELAFDRGRDLPAVHADAAMIEQIVVNLTVNARDAISSAGHIRLTTGNVEVNREASPDDPVERKGRFVCISCTDDGCGMTAEVRERIFEPFFTTKEVGKGTGLGLATVFGIVRQHQGWIEVDSEPGRGTTFRVMLPPSGQGFESLPVAGEGQLTRGHETILIAEDEDILREMVAMVLSEQGYRVITAPSGKEALALQKRLAARIDLLLTDLVMPDGMTGLELAERLSTINRGMKVIYTTGYSPDVAGKDVSKLGPRSFLSKPYNVGALARLLRENLDETTKS
ncbi:MAG TPA: hypothetical protein DCY13_15365 [Verrucomicrobiales bacterium]|nr:hypothetical protein [Verrucomicrobiales bacterium]